MLDAGDCDGNGHDDPYMPDCVLINVDEVEHEELGDE
jgi:hypothetical protein